MHKDTKQSTMSPVKKLRKPNSFGLKQRSANKVKEQVTAIMGNALNQANGAWNRAQAAWVFATTALWGKIIFSAEEAQAAKMKLSVLFIQSGDPDAALVTFCERVLIARELQLNGSETNISLQVPSSWLDENNQEGIARTKPWMDNLIRERRSVPGACHEQYILAESVSAFANNPTAETFTDCNARLLLVKAGRYSELFRLFVAGYTYGS